MTLSITHTHADGTVVHGDPRPHHKILKNAGFRWSPNIGWYLPRSRFTAADAITIGTVSEQLGKFFDIETEIEDGPIDPAEREAFLASNSLRRAEHLAAKADQLKAQAEAEFERARGMASIIPM